MKKILFVVESLGGGGAEKVLLTFIKNLDKEKYDITVFTIVRTGIYVEEIEKYCKVLYALDEYNSCNGLKKVLYLIKMKLIYSLSAHFVYKWLIKDTYDIEIAFVEGFDTKLVAASNNKKSKKISWVHIDMIDRPYADDYYRDINKHKEAYEKFDKIICVSNDAKRAFESKFLINSIVLYNPIEKNEISQYTKENYKLKNVIRICAVGRLEEQKGFDRLINIAYELKKMNYKFKISVLGEGSLKNMLNDQIVKLNLNNEIELVGFKKNPYPYMAESDMLICPSRSEGFSLVIAEAMCIGLPILSTRCAGPTELLDNGRYGIISENSQIDLYKKLKFILDNRKKLFNYHNLSLERGKIFNVENSIRELEKILDE